MATVTAPAVRADELRAQLGALGVTRGGVLVVHVAFSRVAPVDGGPDGLIDALLGVLGPDGTLVMPSMSDDDDHVFDPRATPCAGMGVVAETFWRRPGVLRSDSPHAFAAIGARAAEVTAPHPVEVPHGADSPVGRVHALGGAVLLLGVGHDSDTTVHLAESLAGVRYGIPKSVVVAVGGRSVRREYLETDHCCQGFALLDTWLEEEPSRQRRGAIGHATARLARSRDVVAAALQRLQTDETVFLHPPGVCEECDQARAAIPPDERRDIFRAGPNQGG